MKSELEQLVAQALQTLQGSVLHAPIDPSAIVIERTRDAAHGDFACNIALRLAKQAGRKPRELAEAIVAALPASAVLGRVEIAGAGFINFFLTAAAQHEVLARVLEQGDAWGRGSHGAGRRILLEFVSANPTGPLHVGHGRQAAWGATLANLLRAVGYDVHREYYINDAGRQVDILTASVWLRYLEHCGETLPFPDNGYRGAYVRDIGAALKAARGTTLQRPAAQVLAGLPADASAGGDKELYIDALIARMRELLGADDYLAVLRLSLDGMLADIRDDLQQYGVEFDRWFSERELAATGIIDRLLARLEADGRLYEKDGAQWFRSTDYGDDEDRVLVRANGEKTYFAPDLAYHLDKCERGFGRLLDVLGADHHGYVARVRGGLMALGQPADILEVSLIQFVSLFRGGE